MYQRDNAAGFVRIERLPDTHPVMLPSDRAVVETSRGKKVMRRISGDCRSLFQDLLWASQNPVMARLVVETSDKSFYSVYLDLDVAPTMPTVAEIADQLGLEVVNKRRRNFAFVIEANDEEPTGIERFRGKPKWPEATIPRKLNALGLPELTYGKLVPREIKKFPKGGILFIRQKCDDDNSIADDDNLYFDGVSLDELSQYFEESSRFPVVNQTKDKLLYSFTLPGDVEKQFSFDKTLPLPGLGLSVTPREAEMELLLVRDKQPNRNGEKAVSPSKEERGKRSGW
ncbi:MAG: hypothetical protein ACYC35_28870 [Pirellulales bacterium]